MINSKLSAILFIIPFVFLTNIAAQNVCDTTYDSCVQKCDNMENPSDTCYSSCDEAYSKCLEAQQYTEPEQYSEPVQTLEEDLQEDPEQEK